MLTRSPRSRAARLRPPGSTGTAATLVAATLALAACSGDGDDDDGGNEEPAPVGEAEFTLQLLHFADADGATGALGNVDAFSALLDDFRAEYADSTLVLSSGDNYIPGPRFFAADDEALGELLGVPGPGRADIAFLNAMGVQASAVGNHDLDPGTEAFAALIAPSSETDEDSGETSDYAGAAFPWLSANLDFAADANLAPLVVADGGAASAAAGGVSGSVTIEVDGETIGVVGATTPSLASITSTGDIAIAPADAGDIDALTAEIQTAVDALDADGVDKIVLLAHMQQISIEQALATRLTDVDIIVAGGSNTLLADGDDTLRTGDAAADDYPLSYTSASGESVLLVNTDADYRYVGRLVVGFDAEGRIVPDSLDSGLNGAWATTDENVAQRGATAIPEVAALSDALSGVLAVRDGNIVGRTSVYLDGRRSQVRTEETNLGNLTADANLWLARQADATTVASLKNGGGIRAPIGIEVQPPGTVDPDEVEFLPTPANADVGKAEGDVSEFDLQGALRFNNGLTLLTLTASELAGVLEHAVSASGDGETPGQFPQVAGLRFSFDPARVAREGTDTVDDATVPGERLRTLVIVGDDGNVTDTVVADGAIVGDPSRSFRIVILDFIAKCVGAMDEECGDGYPLKGLAAPDRVDLDDDPGASGFAVPGSEQDALAEYLSAFFADTPFAEAETPASEDLRIQDLSRREDSLATP